MASKPAPGALETVRGFVNTRNIETGVDELATPEGLGQWLAGVGLLGEGATPSEADRERAIELREAIRLVLLSHTLGTPDTDALEALDRIAADLGALVPAFSPNGVSLEPVAIGVRGALARLVAIIAVASIDGDWARLKACVSDDCHWAFYDHARNHSGKWCEMAVCGNRSKARSYRTRAAKASSP